MIWILLLLALVIILSIGVYLEKKGENKFNDADLTKSEKSALDEDYIRRGEHHETDDPEKL